MRNGLWLVLMIGCGGATSDTDALTDGDTAETAAGTSGTPSDEVPFSGAALAELSSGDCPKLANEGTRTFQSSGSERTVVIEFPSEVRPGMPVLFVWHGLGDSASSMNTWMDLSGFAEDNDMIVVLPDSQDRNNLTWDTLDANGDDTVLFDDMRTCLSQELDVDLGRVMSTGFSFGGLFTTFLTMVRGDSLATTVPMSGGTDSLLLPYKTPASQLPVLVMWGGATDTYGTPPFNVDFSATSSDFANRLEGDGHLVMRCDHGGGHSVPFEIHDVLSAWLAPHVYGQPSPFEDGDDSAFPSWCSL
jgi:poly(3-hydroxybutyrate) depolymerase